jgi:hypothetical protein
MARFSDVIAHDADLVALEAGLQDIRPGSDGLLLTLDWNGTPVEALLPRATGGKADAWEPGSRLRLTGLCALAPGGSVPDNGLWTVQRLLLLPRDTDDIQVVRPAPWFNSRRATRLTILLAGGLAVVLVVLWAHSRRQLAQRELARKMAETEFAAILGERNRVARDIHDTLAQGLNAVSMQLELARNAAGKGTEAVLPHVATAHRIVRSCLADARESIWNMRSHVLEQTDLAGALGSVLRQMSAGHPVDRPPRGRRRESPPAAPGGERSAPHRPGGDRQRPEARRRGPPHGAPRVLPRRGRPAGHRRRTRLRSGRRPRTPTAASASRACRNAPPRWPRASGSPVRRIAAPRSGSRSPCPTARAGRPPARKSDPAPLPCHAAEDPRPHRR